MHSLFSLIEEGPLGACFMKKRKKVFYAGKERILDTERPLCDWEYRDGKQRQVWIDPVFQAWKNMFERAYNMENKRPGYSKVTVCDEWFLFSNFENFCAGKLLSGRVLDKDILFPGNSEYGPEKCLFVPPYINTCLSLSPGSKRTHMLGVTLAKRGNQVYFATRQGNRHRGYSKDESSAHKLWQQSKVDSLSEILQRYRSERDYDPRIENSIQCFIDKIRKDLSDGVVTSIDK